MAFFGLTDINFNPDTKRTFGTLSALENTPFKTTTLKYPSDVGSADKGHYVVFFIHEQKKTQYSSMNRGGAVIGGDSMGKAIKDQLQKGTSVADRIKTSKIKSEVADTINNGVIGLVEKGTNGIKNMGSIGAGISNSINGFFSKNVNLPEVSLAKQKINDNITESIKQITNKMPSVYGDKLNTTQMTTDAIGLYMPDTIMFDSTQHYDGLAPGRELLGQALVAAPGLVDQWKKGVRGTELLNSVRKTGALQMLAENATSSFGKDTTRLGIFAGQGGMVVNPMLELIYNAPDFRSFQYDFVFYPRDESEALEVQKIIERFRFHQAPELVKNAGEPSGLLIPPSTFEIKFYYAGRENPNIPAIASCVLQNVNVNYAPGGWAAYEVQGENNPSLGGTGMPVAIQMTLQFKETTYITKEDFDLAVGSSGSTGGATTYSVPPYPSR